MRELNKELEEGDWFKMDNLFIDVFARKIGSVSAAIYLCITRHADAEGYAFPSYKRIAEELNISERTVTRHIEILEDYNLLIRNKKRRSGRWANYSYTLMGRDEWSFEPYDNLSGGHMTKKVIPHDKNNRNHMTKSHIKNTHNNKIHNKNTKNKKTAKPPPIKDKERFGNISFKEKTFDIQEEIDLDDIPF